MVSFSSVTRYWGRISFTGVSVRWLQAHSVKARMRKIMTDFMLQGFSLYNTRLQLQGSSADHIRICRHIAQVTAQREDLAFMMEFVCNNMCKYCEAAHPAFRTIQVIVDLVVLFQRRDKLLHKLVNFGKEM